MMETREVLITPRPIGISQVSKKKQNSSRIGEQGFGKILDQFLETDGIKFSGHAQSRLESRDIQLTQDQLKRLKDAVSKAESKGARESLVLMDELALVVSIKNQTVITAMNGEGLKDNVFTNIDSAVIV